MLRRHQIVRSRLNQALDAAILSIAMVLAYFVRAKFPLGDLPEIEAFRQYWWILLLMFPIGPLVLASQGFYDRPLVPNRLSTVWPLLKACAILALSIIFLIFLYRLQFARSVIILFGVFGFVIIFIKEEILRSIYKTEFGQDRFQRRILLVGDAADNARLREQVGDLYHGSIKIVQEFDCSKQPVSELIELLHFTSANAVLFNTRFDQLATVEQAINAVEHEGVESILRTSVLATKLSRVTSDILFGMPVVVYSSAPNNHWPLLVKQLLDFFGALVVVLLVSPIFPIVAIAIKLTSKGPVFFLQQRAGLNGRPFTMLKFRTMIVNAEELKSALAGRNEMSGPVFKVTNDPRMTKLGKFLRRHSIDEFPQLFNVLIGEMSLVGPRPLPLDEVRRFDDRAHRRRLSVKPGLTCLWQISGRNQITDFGEWVRLDLRYIDNWSLWLDLKILFMTVPAVLLGRGAK